MIRIVYIIVFFLPFIALSQNDDQALVEAISFYQSEDYKSAIVAFSNLEKKGYASDELYYNLASSYFKKDRLAEAVLYYHKALKLNPGHAPSKTNLTIVNDLRASDISPIPDFFLLEWWKVFYSLLSSSIWIIISLIFLSASLFFFYRWLFKASKYQSISTCCFLFCGAILFLLAARSSYNDKYLNKHLVNIESTSLHSGPNDKSNEILEILPGEKLEIIDQLGDWYQVLLVNKEQGWINANVVKEI